MSQFITMIIEETEKGHMEPYRNLFYQRDERAWEHFQNGYIDGLKHAMRYIEQSNWEANNEFQRIRGRALGGMRHGYQDNVQD